MNHIELHVPEQTCNDIQKAIADCKLHQDSENENNKHFQSLKENFLLSQCITFIKFFAFYIFLKF
jgi:heme/copper-type cytochrome/quinol oxidase subunit 3